MLNGIYAYWIEAIGPIESFQLVTTETLPKGSNVLATISLSFLDTLFEGKIPDPTFAADAYIAGWSVYNADGTQSHYDGDFGQNLAFINDCATITFGMFNQRAWAKAQANILVL